MNILSSTHRINGSSSPRNVGIRMMTVLLVAIMAFAGMWSAGRQAARNRERSRPGAVHPSSIGLTYHGPLPNAISRLRMPRRMSLQR